MLGKEEQETEPKEYIYRDSGKGRHSKFYL